MAGTGPRAGREGRGAAPAASAAVLVALGIASLHLVGVRSFEHEPIRSAAPETYLPAWVLAVSSGCLLLGVAAGWLYRSSRPGVAVGVTAAVVGAALPVWASWTSVPTWLRSVVLVAPVVTAAGLSQIALRWLPGRRSAFGASAWLLALTAVIVHGLGYDPFTDPWCSRVCRSAGGPVVEGASSSVVLTVSGLLVLGTVAVGVAGALFRSAAPTAVRGTVGASMVAVGLLSGVELVARDTEVWARTSSVWLPWTVGPPSVLLLVLGVRAAAMRRSIDEVLQNLEGGRADNVHFAVPGERRWVDAYGRDVDHDVAATVVLRDEHGPTVRLVDAAGGDASSPLTPSRQLALANARLTALTAARLDDVRAAQRRVAQRADTERHRIERDLHDGAQQTLVSAAFHLSAAASRADGTREIEETQTAVAAALVRLRELVHGSVPTVVRDEGIRAGLDELVAEADSPVACAVRGDREPPQEVSVVVYLCAAAVVGRAAPAPCSLELDVGEAAVGLVAESATDLTDSLPIDLVDRVGALAGTASATRGHAGWRVEVWLPCGS